VHLWIFLRHLASLSSRPHHECVHGTFYSIRIVFVVLAAFVSSLDVVVVRWGRGRTSRTSRECWRVLGQLCVMVVVTQVLVTHFIVGRGRRRWWGKICVTVTRVNGRRGSSVVMVTSSSCCQRS
jgi:hypothetical protein